MPYLDFTAGQVLTAAQVDDYLMRQTVMVFDDATARSSALGTVVTEGMVTYLKDTNNIEFYDSSQWVDVGLDTNLTADRAIISDGSGDLAVSSVTATELGYLDGVTSSIQDQIDNPIAILATESGTSRTLASADAGKTIRFTSASDITLTIDATSALAVGERVDIIQDGAGIISVTADGVTVAAAETATTTGSFTIGVQYSAASILCIATNNYRLIGNITAV